MNRKNNKLKTKILQSLILGASILTLTGCMGVNVETKTTQTNKAETSKEKNVKQATKDANVLLDFLYSGKRTAHLQDVIYQNPDAVDTHMINRLSKKQEESFAENGNTDDYYLVIDGSNYYASDIIEDYADAYLKQTKQISYNVKEVDVSGDEATITISYYPIAGLEEANPIGTARSELFGGIDEDTFIRQSQNKDIKTIKSLITLKLYAMYYGDLDYEAVKVSKPVELEFTMTKKGDYYTANDDVVFQLVKDSRVQSYQDNKKSDKDI
ncbi:hypothetical protein FH000_15500 [Listeria monocytogenes]|nr:hypothetical protein [Listeria monocytogenes]